MSFVIRGAVSADLEWINSNENGWPPLVERKDPRRRHLDAATYSLNDDQVLVATDERGEPLGWMCVIQSAFDSRRLVLQLLYVDRQHRHRGVARALVEDMFARERNEIILGGWDPELFDVWIKLGFTYEGEESDSRRSGGNMVRPAL